MKKYNIECYLNEDMVIYGDYTIEIPNLSYIKIRDIKFILIGNIDLDYFTDLNYTDKKELNSFNVITLTNTITLYNDYAVYRNISKDYIDSIYFFEEIISSDVIFLRDIASIKLRNGMFENESYNSYMNR